MNHLEISSITKVTNDLMHIAVKRKMAKNLMTSIQALTDFEQHLGVDLYKKIKPELSRAIDELVNTQLFAPPPTKA